jgi:hypothetical protein
MRRRATEADLDSTAGEPFPGDIWWCEGECLRLGDGGKTRPVLLLAIHGDTARVIPLTTRKPLGHGISIAHEAGHSWLTQTEVEVPAISLLFRIGHWTGFAQWLKQRV